MAIINMSGNVGAFLVRSPSVRPGSLSRTMGARAVDVRVGVDRWRDLLDIDRFRYGAATVGVNGGVHPPYKRSQSVVGRVQATVVPLNRLVAPTPRNANVPTRVGTSLGSGVKPRPSVWGWVGARSGTIPLGDRHVVLFQSRAATTDRRDSGRRRRSVALVRRGTSWDSTACWIASIACRVTLSLNACSSDARGRR